jgi:hypothetical protein
MTTRMQLPFSTVLRIPGQAVEASPAAAHDLYSDPLPDGDAPCVIQCHHLSRYFVTRDIVT